MKDSILNTEVSFHKNFNDKSPVDCNLLEWLTNTSYQGIIGKVRAIQDKEKRNEYKRNNLPVITPSGTFTQRGEAFLKQRSGFIQFDIDKDGNDHVIDFSSLRDELGEKNPYISYCGLSASGNGCWGLIKVSNPERHADHWQAMNLMFKHAGLKLDGLPKNVSSLRFYCFDEFAYFNHHPKIFTSFPIEKPKQEKRYNSQPNLTNSEIFKRAVSAAEKRGSFCDGEKHRFLITLAGVCNVAGMDQGTCEELVESRYGNVTSADVLRPISGVYKSYKSLHGSGNNTSLGELKIDPWKKISNTSLVAIGREPQSLAPKIIPELIVVESLQIGTQRQKVASTSKTEIIDHFIWPIEELEFFFSHIPIPLGEYKISDCETASSLPEFIKNSIAILRANDGKSVYYPYLSRLQDLQTSLINDSYNEYLNSVGSLRLNDPICC